MRADWDSYFMQIAAVVASRATCDRKHVGALLVRDRIILSTGYNGSIRGMPHCDDVGHVRQRVLDQVDHAKLEEVTTLAGVITTGESLARAFWRTLAPGLPTGRLSRITVVETAKNRFEYRGEDA